MYTFTTYFRKDCCSITGNFDFEPYLYWCVASICFLMYMIEVSLDTHEMKNQIKWEVEWKSLSPHCTHREWIILPREVLTSHKPSEVIIASCKIVDHRMIVANIIHRPPTRAGGAVNRRQQASDPAAHSVPTSFLLQSSHNLVCIWEPWTMHICPPWTWERR